MSSRLGIYDVVTQLENLKLLDSIRPSIPSIGCAWCPNTICQCAEKEEFDQWQMCTEENGIEVGRCLNDCAIEDTVCQSECVDDYYQDRNRCPCEVNSNQTLETPSLCVL